MQAPLHPGTRHRRTLWLALALATSTSACAARVIKPCDTPPPFRVVLDASEQLNPDARGRSLPTIVHVVQLKDSARLELAGFRDLWQRPEEYLKEDLLQVSEFTLSPGQHATRWIQRDPKARFVLAMGHFRQPLGFSWRTVTSLQPIPEELCVERPAGDLGDPRPGDVDLRFRLQGYQIDLLRQQYSHAGPTTSNSPPVPGSGA